MFALLLISFHFYALFPPPPLPLNLLFFSLFTFCQCCLSVSVYFKAIKLPVCFSVTIFFYFFMWSPLKWRDIFQLPFVVCFSIIILLNYMLQIHGWPLCAASIIHVLLYTPALWLFVGTLHVVQGVCAQPAIGTVHGLNIPCHNSYLN